MQSQLTPLMTPPTTEVKFIRNLISSILPFHWTFTRWSLPTVNYGTARHSLRQIFYSPSLLQRSRKCVAAVLLHWRDDRSIVHCFVPQEEEAARWLATTMAALFAFAKLPSCQRCQHVLWTVIWLSQRPLQEPQSMLLWRPDIALQSFALRTRLTCQIIHCTKSKLV